jgi:hypothetical protein
MRSESTLKVHLRDLALQASVPVDAAGYVSDIQEQLLAPLSQAVQAEFGAGKGQELTTKMRAVHSSSACTVNFFEYWRQQGATDTVARALGYDGGGYQLGFESQRPTGFGGTPPHLDVELSGPHPVGIEAKVIEPWRSGVKSGFRSTYFTAAKARYWSDVPACLQMARAISDGNLHFAHLDAAQLIKHGLGLTRAHGPLSFDLLLLWYPPPGHPEVVETMRTEIRRFTAWVAPELRFRALTWRQLADGLDAAADPGHQAFLSRLRSRYFA